MISIKGLSVSYGRKTVLTNVYLEIPKGVLCGVLGQNGAGKSTLFKAILGLIPVNSGKIHIDGKSLKEQRKRMVYVPQKGDIDWQFPATVFDVVLMGRYPHKKVFQRLNAQDRKLANEALEDMGITYFLNG